MPQPPEPASDVYGSGALSGSIDTGPEPVRLSEAIAEWLRSVEHQDQREAE